MFRLGKHPNTMALEPGKILAANGAPKIDCTILDMSENGARIIVRDATGLPAIFELASERTELFRICKVEWITGNRIGVSFRSAR